MWTALLLVIIAVVVGVAFVVRVGLQDAHGDTADDELWLRDASWWL